MATSEQLTAAVKQLNQQIADLQVASANDIQALNQQVQHLTTENAALKQLVAHKPTVVLEPSTQEVVLTKYNGEPKTLREFQTAYKAHFLFHNAAFPTGKSKVGFLVKHFSGHALTWAEQYISNDDPILSDFPRFETEFLTMFKREQCSHGLEDQLLDCNQGNRDLMAYVAQFHTLAAQLRWPEKVQLAIFRRGLRDDIKDELARVDKPVTIKALVDLALQIDYRISERRAERRKTIPARINTRPLELRKEKVAHSSEEPMQLGTARGPLSKEERQHRLSKGLCLYCGLAGHLVKNCPTKPTLN